MHRVHHQQIICCQLPKKFINDSFIVLLVFMPPVKDLFEWLLMHIGAEIHHICEISYLLFEFVRNSVSLSLFLVDIPRCSQSGDIIHYKVVY